MFACSFVVAATPRTGSTLLCEGLEATGTAGRPAEVFAPDFRELWREFWHLPSSASVSAYVNCALDYLTTRNGVCGLKIMWDHVAPLAEQLQVAGASESVLEALLPGATYVTTVRRDRRAQALSFYRAITTWEWCRFADDELPDPTEAAKIAPPSRRQLMDLEDYLEKQENAWLAYFERHAIAPHTVVYEELVADYRGTVAAVLDFLGLDPSAATAIPPPRLVKQADETTASWRAQLDAEAAA